MSLQQNESNLENSELLVYQRMLENQIFYNRRFDYLCLIEKSLKNEIGYFVLQWDIFRLKRLDIKIRKELKNNFEKLESVFIDSKSGDFSLLIDHVFGACEILEPD